MPTALNLNALTLPTTDVAGSIHTTATLTLGTSVYGHMGSSSDADWYKVKLVAGKTYDFRMMGTGTTPVKDTDLLMKDSTGKILQSNDDSFGAFGLNSTFTFTAQKTGTYFVDAESFGAGDFVLSAVAHNSAGTVLTADEIAWQLTNNFERYFDSAGSANVPATAYHLSSSRQISYNVSQLSTAEQKLAVQALQMWHDVTGINFVAKTGAAQISFANSDPGTDAYNNNVTTSNGTITSSSLMVTSGWFAEFGNTLDSYSFETIVHELGHALGLGHGGNYNGNAEYGVDNFYMNDSIHLSVMSYMQAAYDEFSVGSAGSNTFSAARFRYVLTPMIADIIAMKNLYGLSTTTRTGNTTYGYHSNTGNVALDSAVSLNDAAHHNYVAFTIFDNGGVDTVDMSGYNGAQIINLTQGASSNVLGGKLNMGIAYGTRVENAFGGGGKDKIIGNDQANKERGNAGADQLYGGNGNDSIYGGDGNDFIYGGKGKDYLSGGAGADAFVFSDPVSSLSVDKLSDYSVSADSIKLDHIYFTALSVTSKLSTANFASNLTGLAVRASDHIIYERDTGRIFYDADGAGGAHGVLFATISPNLAGFSAAEFAII